MLREASQIGRRVDWWVLILNWPRILRKHWKGEGGTPKKIRHVQSGRTSSSFYVWASQWLALEGYSQSVAACPERGYSAREALPSNRA